MPKTITEERVTEIRELLDSLRSEADVDAHAADLAEAARDLLREAAEAVDLDWRQAEALAALVDAHVLPGETLRIQRGLERDDEVLVSLLEGTVVEHRFLIDAGGDAHVLDGGS